MTVGGGNSNNKDDGGHDHGHDHGQDRPSRPYAEQRTEARVPSASAPIPAAANEQSPLLGYHATMHHASSSSSSSSSTRTSGPLHRRNMLAEEGGDMPSYHLHHQPYDSYLGDATPIMNNLSDFLQPDYSWRDDMLDQGRGQAGRGGRRDQQGSGGGAATVMVVRDTLDHLERMGQLLPQSQSQQQMQSQHHQQREQQQQQQQQKSIGDKHSGRGGQDDSHKDRNVRPSRPALPRGLQRTPSSQHHSGASRRKNYFLTFVLVASCVASMYVLTVSGPDHSNGSGSGSRMNDNLVIVDNDEDSVRSGGDGRDGRDGRNSRNEEGRTERQYHRRRYSRGENRNRWSIPEDIVDEDGHSRSPVPTLLGIIDSETYDYVDSIANRVYDDMANARFVVVHDVTEINDIKAGGSSGARFGIIDKRTTDRASTSARRTRPRLPTLRADRDEVTFHHRLNLSWRDGTGLAVRDDDVVALYCPATEDDPDRFRDAATVGQIVATGGVAWDDDDCDGGCGGGGGWWEIRRFPIVREESCEFRLWSRRRNRKVGRARIDAAGRHDSHRRKQQRQEEQRGREAADSSSPVRPVFTLAARTGPISLPRAMHEPTAVHLALSSERTEMVVQFTTGVAGVPVVQYGPLLDDALAYDEDYLPFAFEASGSSETYAGDDLCEEPATLSDAGLFVPPGQLHTVRIGGLSADSEYSYRVGVRDKGGWFHDVYKDIANSRYENGVVWSHVHSFHTAPQAVAPQAAVTASLAEGTPAAHPISFLVYSDQGSPANGWEAAKRSVERLVEREITRQLNQDSSSKRKRRPVPRFVQHLGGLSRSYGAAHAWDDWFYSITGLTTRIPLMIAVGDTEYDHKAGGENGKDPSGVSTPGGYAPSWGSSVFGSASGGECGVPTSRRFTMPSTGNGVFWYSYDYGPVHTTVLSSEHDLSPGSDQHRWLLHDFRSVDRSKTPWLILESHRPMYHSQMEAEELEVAIAMRYELEPLMYDFGADLFLSGHAQTYLRTCDGLYRSKCGVGGPVHIAVGTIGARLDSEPMYDNEWTDFYAEERGYGRVTVHNATALHWEFVANVDGKTLDDVWIYKENH